MDSKQLPQSLSKDHDEGDLESSLKRQTSQKDGNIVDRPDDPGLIKSFIRKCDLHLIPLLSLTYLFNSLDRSNLGNAKTAGLATDLKLKDHEYNLVLTFYYVPFIIFAPAGTLMTKVITAKRSLSGMMICFGVASLCTAFVKNFGGLLACRFLVGAFEAAFLPSVVIYLASFYTRADIASRLGLFYAAAVVAAAFGGLLAFGVFHINPADESLYRWSYLFIIEGSLTVLIGAALYFLLPGTLRTAKWLEPDEKDAAEQRLLKSSVDKVESKIVWSEIVMELRSVHLYARSVIGFCFGILLASNANFLPIITARLGYSVVKTNLYTVAPAITAAIILILVCFSSDHFQERGFHMSGILSLSLIGYILLLTIDVANQKGVAYFAIFLCTIGAYPMSVIFSAWTVCNIPNLNARALTIGIIIPVGNAAGLLSSNIFFENEAPRYESALICNCVGAGLCMVSSAAYSIWMRYENRRRDAISHSMEGQSFNTEGVANHHDLRFRFQP
ncbi:retrograde regulation protein 2 [Fusarium oxysporum f. sp. albedinis]|nr:retrograde regulation protein 2 [Fusarium oxysporum f. sp. albedinis]KAJ0137558.1 hypothetical protein HZ326_19472 [Fusarium oxysporum f. sp. albedinis]